MHTIGTQRHPALFNSRDFRLLEMLDGAIRPPDRPPPEAGHDFLVLNPHPDLAADATRVARNCSGGL